MKTLVRFLILLAAIAPLHAQKAPSKAAPDPAPAKQDSATPKAELVPGLDCKFFHTLLTARPEMIVEHDDGHLENIAGENITEGDLVLIEQTSNCKTNSQGEHTMRFCDAGMKDKDVEFSIYESGGDYAGVLTVRLKPDRSFTCSYKANYVTPPTPREYRFKKQTLRLKSDKLEPRYRLYAWISVEFDEVDLKTGKEFPIKIEGYIKPVIKSPVAAE